MKQHTAHIVEMASQGVHLPGLGVVHPPQLDGAVVGCTHNQLQRRMKGRPVHAAFVALHGRELEAARPRPQTAPAAPTATTGPPPTRPREDAWEPKSAASEALKCPTHEPSGPNWQTQSNLLWGETERSSHNGCGQ